MPGGDRPQVASGASARRSWSPATRRAGLGAVHAGPTSLPRGGQDWNELFPQEDDECAPCPAEDELALQDNGFLSKNEVLRSKVSRLTERLRKRYPTNNFGTARGQERGTGTAAARPKSWNCGYGL